MRIKGSIIYFEYKSKNGLIKKSGSDEIYLFLRNELRTNAVLYKGLEVSFKPCFEKSEAIAQKVRIEKEFKTGCIKSMNKEDDRGYIADGHGNEFWFKPSEVILTGGNNLHLGDKVQFFVCEGKHPIQFAYEVACDNRLALAKFALTKNWEGSIESLANLAEKETWSYPEFETEPYPLLKNYIVHTFQNIFEQDKIGYFTDSRSGNSYACFHTGLLSKNNEDIYGVFFKPANSESEPLAPEGWIFNRFTDKWMELLLRCDRTPVPASYRCNRGSESFDPGLEIRTNMDIMKQHNLHVFPKSFLLHDEQQCTALMQESIENTITLLRSGIIIPVPKYFYGSFEFTAPLFFNGKQLDVVLVIKLCDAGYYLANQLILPDIAYKNARLLGPVNSEWLKPSYVFGELPVELDGLTF